MGGHRAVWAVSLLLAAPAAAEESLGPAPSPVPAPVPVPAARPTPKVSKLSRATRLLERFHLFRELLDTRPALLASRLDPGRLFHEPGDPDARFSLGGPTPQGQLHLKASFEVNDVVLRALGPDLRIDPNDPRGRAQGDYRWLDSQGRPYQLRLGARLVW